MRTENAGTRDSSDGSHRWGKAAETWGPVSVSLIAVIATVLLTLHQVNAAADQFHQQLAASARQFQASARDSHYSDIVNGLGSPAAAVQTNSMRLLTEFVEDRSNYASTEAQETGAVDAIQTLMAFIEAQSSTPGFTGLHDYESPQPIVLSRAAHQLVTLESDLALGRHTADISRANLHGISLPRLVPTGTLIAEATDFRRATLSGLDLTQGLDDQEPDLAFAYFTCAALPGARFGTADLLGADLTGADLRGADLSHVQNLSAAQLRGVTVGPFTKLPPDLAGFLAAMQRHPGRQWGSSSARCVSLVDHMTGMQAGWGYLSTHPCPTTSAEARHLTFSPPFDGKRADLVLVCRTRAGLPPVEGPRQRHGAHRGPASEG